MQDPRPSLASPVPVLVLPGFVAPTECAGGIDAFRDVARSCDEVRSTPYRLEVAASVAVDRAPPWLRAWLTDVRERARTAVAALCGIGDRLHVEFTLFSEMRVGDAHPLHADAERRDPSGGWGPNHTPWRHSVALLYLSTWGRDFDGGELILPDRGWRARPRAGELVAFPATRAYCHEVTPITRGSRCSVAMWMTEDPDYREPW